MIVAAALALSTPASAQPKKPSLEVAGDRGALDAPRLEGLVALELGADAPRVVRVVVTVRSGRAAVDVEVDKEHRQSSLAMSAVEPERALALFVAELARGTLAPERTEPVVPEPAESAMPPAAAPVAPPRAPPPPATTSDPWRLSLLGAMGARVTTARGHVLPSPHLELGARREESLRLGVTVRYASASSDDALGSVQAHLLSGGVAATYVLTSSARFALATGPRVELGVVAGSGEGRNADSATAASFAGVWELELHLRLGALTLVGSVEGGSIFRGVELRADDRAVLDLSGPFAGLALGLLY